MNAHTIVIIALGLLAVLQTSWFVVYVTGPWRDTRLGWVWLLQGGLIALVWWLLLVDEWWNVPDPVWAALGVALLVATTAWLAATIRARRGPIDS